MAIGIGLGLGISFAGAGASVPQYARLEEAGTVRRQEDGVIRLEEPYAPSVTPSAQWTGTAGSGYGGSNPPVPTSEARVNGYGAIQIIDPDGTMIGGDTPAGRYIGVHALISDGAGNFGTGTVNCHIEGNVYDVPLTYREWTSNYDGTTTVGAWAHWVFLDPAVWTGNGWANVYWEYVPDADDLQTKVIGPFKHGRQANLIGMSVTVDPDLPTSGSRYQTFEEAKDALRAAGAVNGEIVLMKTADYTTTVSSPGTPVENFPYNGLEKGFTTVRCDAGVTATFRHPGTPATMRPRFTGLKFTGPRMKIDLSTYPVFATEAVGTLRANWLDGVELWNPNGQNSMFAQNYTESLINNLYVTECELHDNLWGFVGTAQLLRNITVRNISGDVTQYAVNLYGMTAHDTDPAYFRVYRDAMQLQYSGAGAGTVAKTGGNLSTAGTLSLVLNGVTHTILLNSFSKTVADVVTEINAIGGMTASTLPDHAVLPSIALCKESAGFAAFSATDIKTAALTLDTFADTHGDIMQQPPDGALVQNVLAWNIVGAQLYFMKDQTFQDVHAANYAACIDGVYESGGASQLANIQRNCHAWHLSILDQQFRLRQDMSYNPDIYCDVRNSVFSKLSWSGTPDADLKIANNHVIDLTDLPAQATGTSTGGTAATLYTSAPTGNWSVAGGSALLSNLVTRQIRYNAYNEVRSDPTTKGAV